MKAIGIIGTRRRDSIEDLSKCRETVLSIYQQGDSFVSGGCQSGGDRFAEIIAKELNAAIVIHPAQWHLYGKRAGFERNTDIARDCDVLIAVVANDRIGGTEDTIKKAKKMGKQIILVE